MLFTMRLEEAPFEQIRSGKKTVELRLYDEKRRRLSVLDRIVFSKLPDEVDKITVVVDGIYRYASFEDLFYDIPPADCGFDEGVTPEQAALEMHRYYSEEDERRFGVVGIGIELKDYQKCGVEEE